MLLTFSFVSWTFNFLICRGVNGGWAMWVIAHLDFGRKKGAAGQRRRIALLLAHPYLDIYWRPWIKYYNSAQMRLMCLALCHKALRVTFLHGLWVEHTSGEGDRERDLIHLYNEVEEKVCFQTLQTNVVRERGICQTLTDGRCTRYAKTTQIGNMKAFCLLLENI